jgi:hypothetical protein
LGGLQLAEFIRVASCERNKRDPELLGGILCERKRDLPPPEIVD